MKKTKFLIVLVLFFSCKRVDQNNSTTSTLFKQQIISWIQTQEESMSDLESKATADSLIMSLQWNSLQVAPINQRESVIYIPYEYNSNKTGLTVLFNHKFNKIERGYISEIVTPKVETHIERNIEPLSIMSNFYNSKHTNFTGSISTYDLSKKFLWQIGFKNGIKQYTKQIATNLPNNLVSIKKSASLDMKRTQGVTTFSCVSFYLVTYWSDGSEDWLYIGGYCNGSDCQMTGVINKSGGEMLIKSFCTVGSISGGGSSTTSNIVTNNIKDPCLKALVNSMIGCNLNNKIATILQNVFNTSNKLNLTFQESTTLVDKNGDPIPAQTTPSFNQFTGILNLTSNIRLDQFDPAASTEYKASIIVHEIVHSYIYTDTSVLNGLTQHDYMLQNYTDNISNYLKGYFPNLSDDAVHSLSLGGLDKSLVGTPAFNTVLATYGFTTGSGSDNFANLKQQFQYGTQGTQCPPSVSGKIQ